MSGKKASGGEKKEYMEPKLMAAGILSFAALSAQAGLASSRSFKKDLKALTSKDCSRVLSKLNAMNLYRFRYMHESRGAKMRLGVIAEEAPREITDQNRKMMNFGSTLGFIMAGIKAQEVRRRQLETEVARQKRQIRSLQQLIRKV